MIKIVKRATLLLRGAQGYVQPLGGVALFKIRVGVSISLTGLEVIRLCMNMLNEYYRRCVIINFLAILLSFSFRNFVFETAVSETAVSETSHKL